MRRGRDDRVAQPLQRRLAGAGECRLVVDGGGFDRDVAGARANSSATASTHGRMAAPRSAEQHDLRVGERDRCRQHAADGARQSTASRPRRRAGAPGRRSRSSPGWRRPSAAKTSVSGTDGRRGRGQHVGDLAGQPRVAAADLPVADDGAAEALAEMDVGEVVELPGPAVALGPRGPVDVVVDDDRPRPGGEHDRRVQVADQERRVGQVDQPPGLPVDGVGRADDASAHRTGARPRRPRRRRARARARPRPARVVRTRRATAPTTCAVDVDDLRHDPLGRDARRPGRPESGRPARSRSRPAHGPWCVRRCRARGRPHSSRRTLSEMVGLEIPVSVASSARVRRSCAIRARSTCSSVKDGAARSDGFVEVTAAV